MRVITIVNQVGVIIAILRRPPNLVALERNPELGEGDDNVEENPEEGPSVVPCSRPEGPVPVEETVGEIGEEINRYANTRDPFNKIRNIFNALTSAFKRSFIRYKDL
ncbi:hypothetical protein SKAU_G00236140 [Synaphobranchus kaupii]|uniref:Uncharacterized protein n=1 Tax=Synaphobranchus kaupii TaxID=118154 RepID=A0A9Q1F6Q9_SYNKA|nr:hypothetical protein SKAU_G00236140 [Synaphobranchus kaupii]